MSDFDLIYLPPTKQFASDEEVMTLEARQRQAAEEMGTKWMLHPDNCVQKKVDI